jgi:RNA polymerase sigma-70 factor (ECF subfamily)
METEIELLDRARRMNKEALVKIFDLYSSALYKYALRLCSDPVLADDIVGDVFAKFLDQLASGNGPKTNLRSYLYQAAYHRMIDEARYSRRRVPLDVTDWFRQDANPIFSGWEDQILFKQIRQIMRDRLSVDQRHVLILRILEGFSIRETAQILGKRAEHIRVIQNRALAVLRRSLEQQGVRKDGSFSKMSTLPKASGD